VPMANAGIDLDTPEDFLQLEVAPTAGNTSDP
jgi:hypothetical protein